MRNYPSVLAMFRYRLGDAESPRESSESETEEEPVKKKPAESAIKPQGMYHSKEFTNQKGAT